jgi:carboxyl-terminal processing protease
MGIRTVFSKARERYARNAAIVLGAAVIFGLGVLTGSGHLRIVPSGQYKAVSGLPKTLDYSSVNQIYDTLRQNYDGKLTDSQLIDGLKHGLAQATNDPYTEYFTAAEAKDFNGQLQGQSLIGIGAQLDQNDKGEIVVMSPIEGSPASAAGLLAKDVIVGIDGQSTAGMSVQDAVKKIRGPKGTQVKLNILRGGNQPLEFVITRDTINVPTATSKVLDDGTGYIQISQFSNDTYDLVKESVEKLQQAGAKKLVLDLRDNPGGEVDSARDISSLWLEKNSLIMQDKRGNDVVDSYRANDFNPLKGVPTVVLVNGGSASASEITALALRDNKAATIIGEKSYGKGVVQSVIPFSDGSELKVTIAKWYSPKGTNIHKKGITPDQTVVLSADDSKAGNDTQLKAAQAYLAGK